MTEATGDHASRERRGCVDSAEPGEAGIHEPPRRLGIGEIADSADGLDLDAERAELVGETVLGIAEHEVVAPGGERPRQRRTDIEARVAHERDPTIGACHDKDNK